ncbi:MAG: acetate kinase [Clostridia bacterium]|nr:acetate kinase [Clostridia bacterium]
MKILVINAGSSSLKYQLIDMETEAVLAKGVCERIGIEGSKLTHKVPGKDDYVKETAMPEHKVAVELVMEALMDAEHGVIKSTDEIDAVGHRVLHGGTVYSDSIVVDEDVKRIIREYFDLGPLHNPANLTGIEACEAAMPGKPNVAVFDTAFGMAMPEKAYTYAIPHEYLEKYSIRRYGFHGTSHNFVSKETIRFGELKADAKVIVCHLGNGASISASIGGKCQDTSMGLTPLEGLIMGSRSGDIDPAVAQYICNKEGKDINEVLNIFNKKSGILGMSGGVSTDFRDVQKAADEGNHLAEVALDAFAYRVAKYIGAYTAAMNGVDAIAFTAGVGENDARMRAKIMEYMTYLGAEIDQEVNKASRGKEAVISTADSKVKVMVVPTNEELMIARDTAALTANL